MMAEADVRRLIDESDIRNLALRYAEAVDGLNMPALTALFTEDGVIEGSGVNLRGRGQIARIEETMRANHDRTYHMVYNHPVRIDGDTATGTVYSRSHHLKRRDDGTTRDLIMTITYNDRYVRQGGGWLIAHRGIDLKWTETRQVQGEAAVR
jgi:ketosteroid isomerase-like protein